jgi:hypothetical protein
MRYRFKGLRKIAKGCDESRKLDLSEEYNRCLSSHQHHILQRKISESIVKEVKRYVAGRNRENEEKKDTGDKNTEPERTD